jgi:hypothetical protein
MASTKIRFNARKPATWTAEGMRQHLQTGTMGDTFYQLVFDWDDAKLQEAFKRANDALGRAGITPAENLCRVRLDRGTDQWTAGAHKRLVAEADLVLGDSNADLLFYLPHERNQTPLPAWFSKDMMYTGREPKTEYAFPTITQKFFQRARDKARLDAMHRTDTYAEGANDSEDSRPDTPVSPDDVSKSDASPAKSTGRSKLDEADVHVGWVVQQDDGSFVLEKDFRSLRTWLDGPTRWCYNFEEIRKSLRMAEDPDLQLFWFEDLAGQPWTVKDHHAIAGAVERMHRKGEICFLLAKSIEFVRALTPAHRGEFASL